MEIGSRGENNVTTEDFVYRATYREALNLVLVRVYDLKDQLAEKDIPTSGRAAVIDAWCRHRKIDLQKPLVAREIIELARAGKPLMEPRRRNRLRTIHGRITALLTP